MKQSDLEFLLKFENITTNNHKITLQNLMMQKQELINTLQTMNNNFIHEKSDINSASYLRFRAIENIRIKQHIQNLDNQIAETTENLRECVKQEKKYDILKQEMITHAKKQREKHQENQSQEYTIFQYYKNSCTEKKNNKHT